MYKVSDKYSLCSDQEAVTVQSTVLHWLQGNPNLLAGDGASSPADTVLQTAREVGCLPQQAICLLSALFLALCVVDGPGA